LLACLVAAGCSDGRPDAEAAVAIFEAKYPEVEIVSVSHPSDEVVARSYRFRYRKPGNSEIKNVGVQFMEVDGNWQPRPPLPDSLP
jgi:hypothetical protein